MLGYEGDDVLNGDGGNDQLYGLSGNDTIDGGDGQDTVSYYNAGGGIHLDLAAGTLSIPGDTGETESTVMLSSIEAYKGAHNFGDTLQGDAGNNIFMGLGGNDLLVGRDGNDQLFGSDGHDTINGDAGDDTLEGGIGDDVMSGGAGNDRFIYDGYTLNNGHDRITDIQMGDKIDFTANDFGNNSYGVSAETYLSWFLSVENDNLVIDAGGNPNWSVTLEGVGDEWNNGTFTYASLFVL